MFQGIPPTVGVHHLRSARLADLARLVFFCTVHRPYGGVLVRIETDFFVESMTVPA